MAGRAGAVEQLVQSILSNAGVLGAKQLKVWKQPRLELYKLLQANYASCLRRHLDAGHVRELISRATEIWPKFNREALGPPSKESFTTAAQAMDLHFEAAPYSGLALRGFYVDADGTHAATHKPLIYVNSAHHAVAVGTTFCHEVGHHLSAQSLKPQQPGVRLYFDAVYSGHLREAGELTADVLVSLAGYPLPAAEHIFADGVGSTPSAFGLHNQVFLKIRAYLKDCYGFDFLSSLPASQNLHYLAGLAHYAKLRKALLNEFGV